MNDDEYGTALLRPLAGEPTSPPRIDVVKAMRDGRRMRRRRWWRGGSALTVAIAAALTGGLLMANQDTPRPQPDLPPDPILPASCTAAELPAGPHKSAEVSGGDGSGAWLVGVSDAHDPTPSVPHSVLVWHDGELVADVRPPGLRKGSIGVRMNDINSSGVAVGSNLEGNSEPWVFADGKVRKLAGGAGEAVAINDAGVIAGQSGGDAKRRPVRWASPTAQPVPLPLPPEVSPLETRITDIAPDGTIAAEVGWRTYLWRPDGTGGFLPLPTVGGKKANGFMPMAFAFGWLYGTVTTPITGPSAPPPGVGGGDTHLYRVEPNTGTWQKLPGDPQQVQVAGTSFGQFMTPKPEVFAGREVLNLPAYGAPVMSGTGNTVVENVSDDARFAAGTVWSGNADPSKPAVPVIWRCR
ncbi:hypothetical protein KOI35_00150 [Actinoplanes bogorensis]|uniref:Uncharacterized protein n=1 Tax=Paractinoplanes bogorensis TaxID=1610840 RepID=A0ABS5YF20_9ACTN|nr:hypothetical protein [Actinoplanes bogorensis]MBU2661907.1 hypothetical protein [Actinoplanes bogorensis]